MVLSVDCHGYTFQIRLFDRELAPLLPFRLNSDIPWVLNLPSLTSSFVQCNNLLAQQKCSGKIQVASLNIEDLRAIVGF